MFAIRVNEPKVRRQPTTNEGIRTPAGRGAPQPRLSARASDQPCALYPDPAHRRIRPDCRDFLHCPDASPPGTFRRHAKQLNIKLCAATARNLLEQSPRLRGSRAFFARPLEAIACELQNVRNRSGFARSGRRDFSRVRRMNNRARHYMSFYIVRPRPTAG